ncbi:putative rhamnogalacturonate lyase C [Parachaetomium inaequale]|uniref:Rhamnogalacturonate lyase C n=1 Tax=Parachaetomium inaequale TaxID=2588326 RepID=A0AAN6PHK2_9PEZI|nr:putative rhamnogalacturonate lyase C [Parachaetomium inaequale]
MTSKTKSLPLDVAIHCGDITEHSQLSEYKTAIDLLSQIDAPLKLIIPGNHDFTLDTPTYQHLLYKSRKRRDFSKLLHSHGQPGDARHLFDAATKQHHNIHHLDEGTHRFPLANGALLTVYASPYTPAFGTPGFQYTPQESHDFAIPDDVDVVITHGPPRGVLDRSWASGAHVGSAELFAAVARARPRLHCFGHIHEGWGGEVLSWQGISAGAADGDGDGGRQKSRSISRVIADLGTVLPLKGDDAEMVREKERRLGEYARGKCVKTSHCRGDALPVEKGATTLFVNAAVVGKPVRPAWVVDLELPNTSEPLNPL